MTSEIGKLDVRLKLKRQSPELDNISYIIELFKGQIPNETNNITRFYIYYQVVEILISKVFDDIFDNFVLGLSDGTNSLFDKREELTEMTGEKYRIKKLFADYSYVDSELKKF